MQIDWITVSAQIINFLVLVYLLKRFLYEPVIRAMDRREQRIADRLNEAKTREQEAEERSAEFLSRKEELEQKQNEVFAEAREEAEQEKRKLMEQARNEIAELRKLWQRQVNQEKEEFLKNLQKQTAEVFRSIAGKALTDLGNIELEEQMIISFIQRLKAIDQNMRKALLQTNEPVQVVTSYTLDSTLRSRLTRAIHENLAKEIEVQYSQSNDLLCGIELKHGGQRLSWNLADYLEQLGIRIEGMLGMVQPTE